MADEVEALRSELMEAAAGSDEELMEKFFDTMELSAEDMAQRPEAGRPGRQRLPGAVRLRRHRSGRGDADADHSWIWSPWPRICPPRRPQDDDGNDVEVACDPNGPTAAIVFKTISDQYGKYSMVKVAPWQDHQRYGPV